MPTPRKVISPDGNTCIACHRFLPWDSFSKDSGTWYGRRSICKTCSNIRSRKDYKKRRPFFTAVAVERYRDGGKERARGQYKKHRARYLAQRDKYWTTPRGRMASLYFSAVGRAKKKSLAFDLTIDWLVKLFDEQHGRCSLTGIAFDLSRHGSAPRRSAYNPYSPSVDRIDSAGGYTKANVRLVCTAMNIALNGFGDENLERISVPFLEKRGYIVTRDAA